MHFEVESQPIVQPPSTMNGAPVANDDSSLARNRAIFAISSGLPIRPSVEMRLIARSDIVPPPWIRETIGVSIAPGQIALTRMLCRPFSSAATFVIAITPALAAQYADELRKPTRPAIEAVLTIAPPPFLILWAT